MENSVYNRRMFRELAVKALPIEQIRKIAVVKPGQWADKIYCKSSEDMSEIPDNSIGLAFTSPPYNVGKEYEEDLSMNEYLGLIERVGREVYRVLRPGGRYIINVGNVGKQPCLPLHYFFYKIHWKIGFISMGEIIWQKSDKPSGSFPCKIYMGAKSPCWCEVHEYLLVFVKNSFTRPDRGKSSMTKDEFEKSKLSIWKIPIDYSKYKAHPAPFPIELASRVIKMFSYENDVVLDPFSGSGTTCVAAMQNKRHYVGYDVKEKYCRLARGRIGRIGW